MYYVKNISETLSNWNITDIKKKMMIFNYDKKMIAVSVIHTELQSISSGIN